MGIGFYTKEQRNYLVYPIIKKLNLSDDEIINYASSNHRDYFCRIDKDFIHKIREMLKNGYIKLKSSKWIEPDFKFTDKPVIREDISKPPYKDDLSLFGAFYDINIFISNNDITKFEVFVCSNQHGVGYFSDRDFTYRECSFTFDIKRGKAKKEIISLIKPFIYKDIANKLVDKLEEEEFNRKVDRSVDFLKDIL